MIPIIINGKAGCGKSTLLKLLEEKLGRKSVDGGVIFREQASESGMTLAEFVEYRKTHPEVDRKIDAKLIELSENKPVVVQSRTLPHLYEQDNKKAFKVFLNASDEVCAQRLGEREGLDGDKALTKVQFRDKKDQELYKKVYGIDITDLSVYDLVVDTENKLPPVVAQIVIDNLPPQARKI